MLGILLPSSFPSSLGLLSWREGPWWQKWSRWDNWNFSRSSCCLIRWPTTFLNTFTRFCGWLVLIYCCCQRYVKVQFTTYNIYIEIYKPLCGLKGLVRRVAWPSAVLFECGLFCSGSLSCWFLWVVNEAAFGSVFALGGGGRLGREGGALLQNNNQKKCIRLLSVTRLQPCLTHLFRDEPAECDFSISVPMTSTPLEGPGDNRLSGEALASLSLDDLLLRFIGYEGRLFALPKV